MKKNKIVRSIQLAAVLGSLVVTFQAPAQHYMAGEEGIKGGSLPPPGVYFRDYNFIYAADLATRYIENTVQPGGQPLKTPNILHTDQFAYVQAPRLIWITDKKILGADYGMAVMLPFGYLEGQRNVVTTIIVPGGRHVTSFSRTKESTFGLGDIEVEPLLLSWHKKQFDVVAGYAFWAPTGCFDKDHLSLGNGFWSHMITLGGVWYPDMKKTWAISLLDRYEINHEQEQTHITYGNRTTLEWGISKTVVPNVDLGFIGYYQQAITPDSGKGTLHELVHVVGVGPEINVFWSKIGMSTSLRYAYEADAKGLPQGHRISLTLTKQF